MEAVLTKQSRIAPRTAVAKPVSAADRDRHRRAVRRRRSDHRHRRRARLADRPGDPRLAVGAQDPARGRRRRRHGRDVRRAARGGRARDRAAALRVLDARVRPARRRRRASPAGCTRCSSARARCSRCRPTTTPGSSVLPAFVAARRSGAGCSPSSSAGACSRSRAGTGGLPVGEFWHPVIGAVVFATIGLFVPRALGVGYDAIGDVLAEQARGRHRRGRSRWPSCSRGGSRSARARRAARSRRSC